jgi:SAM-dependent methyltransferase
MTDVLARNPPSPFIARLVRVVARDFRPGSLALDVATGRRCHALTMAAAGFRVLGIDLQFAVLTDAAEAARAAGLPAWFVCADLTTYPLPRARFSLIVVVRYLDRNAFQCLKDALVPGGVLLYETFTTRQLQHGRGPRSRSHLLDPGELRMLTRDMEMIFDEEVFEPDAVARVAARRR